MRMFNDHHTFTGMQRDLDPLKHPANMLYDAKNIRITARGEDTLLAITNERGTTETHIQVSGYYLGHCLLNNYLVVFSTGYNEQHIKTDYIERIDLSSSNTLNEYDKIILFQGELNFSNPIEATGFYENENLQKIYWVDGRNQPRMINIKSPAVDATNGPYINNLWLDVYTKFDFVRPLQLKETVKVSKLLGTAGIFPAGVLQYCFTYYSKHGQESNVFYATPLLYTSYKDRGGSPEDTIDNAFKITMHNIDMNFDYLRIYAIMRTSVDGTPACRRVQDIDLSTIAHTNDDYYCSFVDNGTMGNTIDPYELLYKGGEIISAETIEQKDGTLFLGNLRLQRESLRYYVYDNPTEESDDPVEEPVDPITPSPTVPNSDYDIPTVGEEGNRNPRDILSPIHYQEVEDPAMADGAGGSDTGGHPHGNVKPPVDPGDIEPLDYPIGHVIDSEGDPMEEVEDTTPYVPEDGDTLEHIIQKGIKDRLVNCKRQFYSPKVFDGSYVYSNQLTSYDYNEQSHSKNTDSCTVPAGFKTRDYYRLGIQFQHESGRWSDPIYLRDILCINTPSFYSYTDGNNNTITEDDVFSVPAFKGTIPSNISEFLLGLGYKRARGVIVYPAAHDRVVACQGVVDSTLMLKSKTHEELQGTVTHTSYSREFQSSWFFRPVKNLSGIIADSVVDKMLIAIGSSDGSYSPVFRQGDNTRLWYMDNKTGDTAGTSADPKILRAVEIQGCFNEDNQFEISNEVLTLHSPDIQFNEDLWIKDFSNSKFMKVGWVNFTKTLADIDIQTETPTMSSNGGGFKKISFTSNNSNGIISGPMYDDYLVEDYDDGGTKYRVSAKQNSAVKFVVYPWQRSGSLNNDINREANAGTRTAKLKQKIISNLRIANTNYTTPSIPYNVGNLGLQIFHDDFWSITKLNDSSANISSTNIHNYTNIYKGNIDTMLVPDKSDGMYYAFGGSSANDYQSSSIVTTFKSPIIWKTFAEKTSSETIHTPGVYKFSGSPNYWSYVNIEGQSGDQNVVLASAKENVRMKYKSTPHGVLNTSDNNNILPTTGLSIIEVVTSGDGSDPNNPYYRGTMFGGTSEDAFKANTWIPCGEPVTLSASADKPFYYIYGDTYYQRWDCMKTYAYTPEDVNQIVEIGSFMLETHVNIDGRYDRNRGQMNNLYMSPLNFNLVNPVYTQTNNFFTYKILDKSQYVNSKFPNQVTWSMEKHAGEDIDTWTNVSLGSTLDMNGLKGGIVSIKRWRDDLLCFQYRSVSKIMFNVRAQIPVSDGVPIEITNSYKVDGYKIVLDNVGCSSKNTVKATPSGVYFIDNVSNHLYNIGEGVNDVTATHNMSSWFKNNRIDRVLYDDVNHDLYLVNMDTALCFSEILGQFTSFFDYDNMKLLESYNKDVFAFREFNTDRHLCKMFTGKYNYLFDEVNPKPWSITFISNGSENSLQEFDKIFSNVDFRMDTYKYIDSSQTWNLDYTHDSMDSIRVFDAYQDTREVELTKSRFYTVNDTVKMKDPNLQRKFRIWRIQIPRNYGSMDRIRDTWCGITLQNNGRSDNTKSVLHDLNVQFYI